MNLLTAVLFLPLAAFLIALLIPRNGNGSRRWALISSVAFFAAWELIVRLMHIKAVILPAPSIVFEMIWEQRALLLKNTWPTFVAISLGFFYAIVSGAVQGAPTSSTICREETA